MLLAPFTISQFPPLLPAPFNVLPLAPFWPFPLPPFHFLCSLLLQSLFLPVPDMRAEDLDHFKGLFINYYLGRGQQIRWGSLFGFLPCRLFIFLCSLLLQSLFLPVPDMQAEDLDHFKGPFINYYLGRGRHIRWGSLFRVSWPFPLPPFHFSMLPAPSISIFTCPGHAGLGP